MDCDVAIVGTGVAGALAGYELCKKGMKVSFLEAGAFLPERAALMKKYYGAEMKTPSSPYPVHDKAPKPSFGNKDAYYVRKGPDRFKSTYERCVGGSTWHWLGSCLRLLPEDFSSKTNFNFGVDWPLSYDDLEPWYLKAEKALGVAGDNQYHLGSPRSGPYPKRPIALSYSDELIKARLMGQQFRGKSFEVSPTPQARDPDLCQGSSTCIPLCPMGAKYEAMTHIVKAQKLGAKVLEKSVVYQLLRSQDSTRINGIKYRKWDGSEHRLTAKVVIVAANAIETTKILLQSVDTEHQNAVANSSGLVGRYLMDHIVALSWALSKKALHPFRGPLSTAGIDGPRGGISREEKAAYRLELHNDGWGWAKGAPKSTVKMFIEKGYLGKALKDKIKDHLSKQLSVASLIEQAPEALSRVTISHDKKDALGIPRPVIDYRLTDYEREGLASAKEGHEFVFKRLGVSEFDHHSDYFGAGHLMGTYRMGDDPKTSVVNRDSQTHEMKNLFLLGSGVFPTGGTANPTLTIAALALKAVPAVEGVLKNLV